MKSNYTCNCFCIILIGLLLVCAPACVRAEEAAFGEYEIKAGFIYNFIKFTEWPDESRLDSRKVLVVGIFGQDPFGNALDQIHGKVVRGMRIEVRRLNSVKDLKNCGVLFIDTSEKNNIGRVLEAVKDLPVLTIGDTDGFSKQGIIINFYTEQNKIRFEINTEKARQAKLALSSKLLRLARITSGGQQ